MRPITCRVLLFLLFPLVALAQTRVDVLVLYTPACRDYNGGTSGVRAFIDTAVAAANTAYANSQIDMRLNLVAAVEVNYTENADMGVDLGRLANGSDGYLDNAASLRNTYGADLVCLMRRNTAGGTAGIAYLLGSPTSPSSYAAWSVTADNAAVSNHTFAHELGHNMGCLHARPESSSGGAYTYSFGHRFYGTNNVQYRTVMAYSPGTRIAYFSNPSVSYQGTATGVAVNQANPANNALSISNTKSVVAAFKAQTVGFNIVPTSLFWQKTDGTVRVWHMSGTTRSSTEDLPGVTAPSGWRCMGIKDLNSDGHPDIMWQNTNDGRIAVWWMNTTTRTSSQVLSGVSAPTGWTCIGVADFNSDGHPDIAWQNTNDGRIAVWFMNGATRLSSQVLAGVSAPGGWRCMGVGDLNADGKADILWQNQNDGRIAAWWMNGTTRTSSQVYAGISAPSGWTCVNLADYNNDGYPDIVWMNDNDGRLAVWNMRGATRSSVSSIGNTAEGAGWSSMAREQVPLTEAEMAISQEDADAAFGLDGTVPEEPVSP